MYSIVKKCAPAFAAGVVGANDVGMGHAGQGLDFPHELLDRGRVARHLRQDDLEGNFVGGAERRALKTWPMPPSPSRRSST